MGKCETSTASLGIKIILSDLIEQINENNFDLIKKMLYDGFIEDCNNYFNDVYKKIIGYDDGDIELPENYLEFKEYLIKQFKNNGSYYKFKDTYKVEPNLKNGCLFDKELLIPIKEILSTERWGYNREGTNGTYRLIDFDLSITIDDYKMIKKFQIVFIVKQHSG